MVSISQKLDELSEGPFYVYFESELIKNAQTLISSFKDTTVRFAMKASSNKNILKLFDREGLHFDCSSVYEVERVLLAGIDPSKIELVAQEVTLKSLSYLEQIPGHEHIKLIACSPYQLEIIATHPKFKSQLEGIRLNPGFGSGETKKTTVAGPSYSFGIWSERLEHTLDIINKHSVKVKKIHSHIGAGNDP